MNELEAFSNEWKTGDRTKAKEMAREYVDAHRQQLALGIIAAVKELRKARLDDPPSLADLVDVVSVYRATGREDDRIAVDMWLLSEVPQQHITGSIAIKADSPFLEAVTNHLKGGR